MLIQKALEFATRVHNGQKRKYTGEDYIVHPVEVMEIVKTVPHTEAMLAAALLHDVIEDCGVHLEELQREFGTEVSYLVLWLTDISKKSDGARKVRKEIDRQHTAKAPAQAKTIKLADLISNTTSIVQYDPSFAKVYLAEKARLLDVLTEGDATLYARAKIQLDGYFSKVITKEQYHA